MFNQYCLGSISSLARRGNFNLVRQSRLLIIFHINPLLVTVQAMFLFCGARSATGNDPRYRSLHGSLIEVMRIETMLEIISMVNLFGDCWSCDYVWVRCLGVGFPLQIPSPSDAVGISKPQMVQTYFFCAIEWIKTLFRFHWLMPVLASH